MKTFLVLKSTFLTIYYQRESSAFKLIKILLLLCATYRYLDLNYSYRFNFVIFLAKTNHRLEWWVRGFYQVAMILQHLHWWPESGLRCSARQLCCCGFHPCCCQKRQEQEFQSLEAGNPCKYILTKSSFQHSIFSG